MPRLADLVLQQLHVPAVSYALRLGLAYSQIELVVQLLPGLAGGQRLLLVPQLSIEQPRFGLLLGLAQLNGVLLLQQRDLLRIDDARRRVTVLELASRKCSHVCCSVSMVCSSSVHVLALLSSYASNVDIRRVNMRAHLSLSRLRNSKLALQQANGLAGFGQHRLQLAQLMALRAASAHEWTRYEFRQA